MSNLTNYFQNLIQKDLDLLGSKENIKRISLLAKSLPETDRIAFETTLQYDKNIDIHYNIRISNQRIYNTFLESISNQEQFTHENWKKVTSLLTNWKNTSDDIYKNLEAIFLEFDTSKNDAIHPPAIFFKINHNTNKEQISNFIKHTIEEINSQDYYQKIEECLKLVQKSLPESGEICYSGIMLSRDLPVLRINTHGIKRYEIIQFLQKINWKGNYKEVEYFIDNIHPLIDVSLLSFDIYNNKILDKIGFEFKIQKPQRNEIRYHKVFKELREKGLLTLEKEKYLIDCNKTWTPQNTDWHPSLIYNSLFKPLNSVDQIDYFLSHLKYVITNEDVLVKAYTGMCQNFSESKTIQFKNHTSIKASIQSGIKFLIEKNNQSGYWTDYLAFGSVSDQWITGLVGSILLYVDPSLKTNTILIEANKLLNSKDQFGYNQCTVSDGDSSAWCILFNKLMSNEKWLVQYENLKRTFFKENGFITYQKSPLNENTPEWKEVHMCVTASANLLKQNYSNLIQDSLLESKWWESKFYTAALYKIANGIIPKKYTPLFIQELNTMAKGISENQNINIFNLALLLISTSSIENRNKKTLINFILSKQRVDGGWTGDAKMKLNDKSNKVIVDQNNLVTTAFVIMALKMNKL